MADVAEDLLQDYNGDDVFSNSRALVGFLEASKYLIVPKEFWDYCERTNGVNFDLKTLGGKNGINDFIGKSSANYRATTRFKTEYGNSDAEKKLMAVKIVAMNFKKMVDAGISNAESYVIAALRARWCMARALEVTSNDMAAIYNEVEVYEVQNNNSTHDDIMYSTSINEVVAALGNLANQFTVEATSPTHGNKWIIKHSENIWCAVEHCFRVRSHHFKTTGPEAASYTALYTRYLKACYEGNFEWPSEIDMFEVFHTAIHPFRLKALPVIAAHMIAYGTVANAALIRFSGSPCGNAVITTTNAALDTMKAEVWWKSFESIYSNQLEMLAAASDAINDDKYSFHIGARLYGLEKAVAIPYNGKDYTPDELKSSTSGIAAAAQGMINALKAAKNGNLIATFALENAKSLEKAAASNPMLSVKTQQVVITSIEMLGDTKTVEDAVKIAFAITK